METLSKYLTKNKREGDGAMAVGGHRSKGEHNNQQKVGVCGGKDQGRCETMAEHVGSAFCHRLAVANEAMKNIKIKIRCCLTWPPKDEHAYNNQPKTNDFDGGEMG